MKITNNYYAVYKYSHRGGVCTAIYGKDKTLFAGGVYPSQVKASDLPEWFIYGRFHKVYGYLNAKDVKDIIYKPNLYDAEAFKYDFLYISYKGKMKPTTDKKLGFISYGEDHVIYGHEILYFMRGVKKYSSFDTSEIMAKIYAKLVWLKANHPEIYQSRMGENFDLDKFMSEN